ncbi:MAG: PaaI family thioesterase [Candidatus Cloacimonetes bacterium]|jgi:uncharacterized protein (TIGR00369 family)|nr:PaaI family thioesterase [Candidatus Cloacimonadota bacterium]MDD4156188.1 PaaI family thioesterase [Candidatus Cloacimonadota bacterium]
MQEKEYKNCFLCGKDNPIGLKLDFYYQGDKALCDWKSLKVFEGYDGIIHGGIIASILDEAVAKAILYKGIVAVTSELNVKYLKPFPVNTDVKIIGEVIDIRKKIIIGKAKIIDKLNTEKVIAKADAKYFILS